MTSGQRWPKVLITSAVCGLAPPELLAANPFELPPAAPLISQELLSVI